MTTIPILGSAEVSTQRLIPSPRRPEATGQSPVYHPRTIGIVDPPLSTAELPPWAQFAACQPVRPAPFERQRRYRSRHRRPAAVLPGDAHLAAFVVASGWFTAGATSALLLGVLIGAGW